MLSELWYFARLFEVKEHDVCGRLGLLRIGRRKLTTPLLLPVVNPKFQPIPPKEMRTEFGIQAIFTNAYIIYKDPALREIALERGLHDMLNFKGVIATDSGAYQGYVYGRLEVEPAEIESFQEEIGADMAVILDVPVSLTAPRKEAEQRVADTIRRARENVARRKRVDLLWLGPIHGARHTDLVKQSAIEMSRLDFPILALGSVVEALTQYRFDLHVDIMMAAKRHVPPDRPLHIFGVGHPMFFAIPVALGYDMFDSSSYALFARDGRYITSWGTIDLERLSYFPCSCKVCTKYTPEELRELPQHEREELLARHNLSVCAAEVERIRQAIAEGRLWELVELRAHSHPSLLDALRRMQKYAAFLERYSPVTKARGMFYFGSTGLARPEIVRHAIKMRENYARPRGLDFLLLLPQTVDKPFHKSKRFKRLRKQLEEKLGRFLLEKLHICFYAAPFGIVPAELDETYPLSQFEMSGLDYETLSHVARQVKDYLQKQDYRAIILHEHRKTWGESILSACRMVCEERGTPFYPSGTLDAWSAESIEVLIATIEEALTRA